jgi:hypothetical protein
MADSVAPPSVLVPTKPPASNCVFSRARRRHRLTAGQLSLFSLVPFRPNKSGRHRHRRRAVSLSLLLALALRLPASQPRPALSSGRFATQTPSLVPVVQFAIVSLNYSQSGPNSAKLADHRPRPPLYCPLMVGARTNSQPGRSETTIDQLDSRQRQPRRRRLR